MRTRCNNPNRLQFKDWGGRGIEVCARWNDSAVFIDDILTTIGLRPPNMVLDRIDNNGPYSPDNVKWSTYLELNRNKRPSKARVGRSGVSGVRQVKRRWMTTVGHNGKQIYVGMFPTIEFASAAYCDAAKRLHDDPYMVIDATYHEAIDRLLDEAKWNRIEAAPSDPGLVDSRVSNSTSPDGK